MACVCKMCMCTLMFRFFCVCVWFASIEKALGAFFFYFSFVEETKSHKHVKYIKAYSHIYYRNGAGEAEMGCKENDMLVVVRCRHGQETVLIRDLRIRL